MKIRFSPNFIAILTWMYPFCVNCTLCIGVPRTFFSTSPDESLETATTSRDPRRIEDEAGKMLVPKLATNFFILNLIIALVASNCYFFNRLAAKVHRSLLMSASLCSFSLKGKISLSLSFRLLGPSHRLILSSVYLIALTKRESSSNSSWQFRRYLFFSRHTTPQVPSSPPPRPPSRSKLQKTIWHHGPLVRRSSSACRFFTPHPVPPLRELFLAIYLTCHSPSDIFRDRDTGRVFRPSIADFGFSVRRLLFFYSPTQARNWTLRLVILSRHTRKEGISHPRRPTITFSAKSTKLDDLLYFLALSKIVGIPQQHFLRPHLMIFIIRSRAKWKDTSAAADFLSPFSGVRVKGEWKNICPPPLRSTYD